MRKNKKTFILSTILFLSLFFESCSLFLHQNVSDDDKVYVTFGINNSVRTVLPQAINVEELKNIEFCCWTYPDGEKILLGKWDKYADIGDANFKLNIGIYDFQLEAYINDKYYFGFNSEVEVTGETKSLYFTLLPVNEYEGNIKIKLSYPKDSDVTNITVNLLSIDGSEKLDEKNLIPSDNSIVYEKTASGGDYLLRFNFYSKNKLLLGMYSEVVSVVNGFKSEAERTLDAINNENTISYNLDGGSFSGTVSIPSSFSALSQTFDLPSAVDIDKYGYIFEGWYTNPDFEESSKITQINKGTTEDIKVYAKWRERNFYEISFDLNGGIGQAPEKLKKYEDIDIQVGKAENVIKEGYIFYSWNTKADGSGSSYKAGDSVTFNESITLYAIWKRGYELVIDNTNAGVSKIEQFLKTLSVNTLDNPYYIKLIEEYSIKDFPEQYLSLEPISLPVYTIFDFSEFKDLEYYSNNWLDKTEDSKLVDVILPSSLKSMHINERAYSSSLNTKIYIGKNLQTIYVESYGIDEFVVDSENQFFSAEDGVLYNKDKTTLIKYPDGKKSASLKLPDSVTYLKDGTFANCVNLISISLSQNIERIGDNTFNACINLESVELPANLKEIGDSCFRDCKKLKSIEIPAACKKIESRAFAGCSSLSGSINIPQGCQQFVQDAFHGTSINEINLPASINTIILDYFGGNLGYSGGFEKLNISEDNPFFKSENGVLFSKDMKELILYPAGKKDLTYTVPDGVEEIDSFTNNPYIKEIILPDSLVDFSGKKTDYIEFDNSDGYTFNYCTALEKINIPTKITVIPRGCFNATSLKNIDIPEGIEDIGVEAFDGTKIEELVLPSTLKKLSGDGWWMTAEYLKVITFKASDLPEEDLVALIGRNDLLEKIYVPMGSLEKYKGWNLLGHGLSIPIIGF